MKFFAGAAVKLNNYSNLKIDDTDIDASWLVLANEGYRSFRVWGVRSIVLYYERRETLTRGANCWLEFVDSLPYRMNV